MIKRPSRSFVWFVVIGIVLITIGGTLWFTHKGEEQTTEVAEPTSLPLQVASTTEPSIASERALTDKAFTTASTQAQVLWQDGRNRIYVQNNRLYAAADGKSDRSLHDWEGQRGRTAQAWVNGEYLLLGTQLIEAGSAEEGHRGEWMALRLESTPEVMGIEPMFFGPEETLTVKAAEEPRLFVLAVRNGDGFTEYVFDPALPEERWTRIETTYLDLDPQELKMPDKTDSLLEIGGANRYAMADDATLYEFKDASGSLLYATQPYTIAKRFVDFELTDARKIKFLDRGPDDDTRIFGKFRNAKGEEWMSFADNSFYRFSLEPRLWEEAWDAIDEFTFVRLMPEKLEALRFELNSENSRVASRTRYREFPIHEGYQVSAQGSLLRFERGGDLRFMTWRDLVNVDPLDERTLLQAPLQGYAVKEEPRPTTVTESVDGRILEGSFEGSYEENANADIPNELRDALQEAYPSGDYGRSNTFRKVGSDWFVISDRVLATYKDGKMTEIGALPLTISIEVSEGFGGHGARDFARVDGGWVVADTEASRVLKLNEELEIVAELAVPMPYGLSVDGNRLRIASLAHAWVTDMELRQLSKEPQPFVPFGGAKLTEHKFSPQEWYEDRETGLIWYTFNGLLYQVDESRKQYRSFYIGNKENALGRARIVPRGDEVRVLLDRKLERFDRHGDWLGSLAYPRVQPDGIYDHTTQGEGSLIFDEAKDVYYLVQGYRVLCIDMKRGEAKTIFRQNHADIGKLARDGDKLYFLLRSNEEDRYTRRIQLNDSASSPVAPMNTQLVEIDVRTFEVRRSFVEGFIDIMAVNAGTGIVLTKYTS